MGKYFGTDGFRGEAERHQYHWQRDLRYLCADHWFVPSGADEYLPHRHQCVQPLETAEYPAGV